ncbi:MAG: polysaccharide deacetylase family protein [Candidatus Bathyarchaeota archaeon]|nr:polysaccharide deacetylase family protein [Candidatus Bathyarchaeota archaeon]
MAKLHKFLFTFDVEDFINQNAIYALQKILIMLQKHELTAIFFITGHMAEKIRNYPKIVAALKKHEIGYHSSSHSVHPTIPEYTDMKNYEKAYRIALERETSHINPLTGRIEGEGGICTLQDVFHPKKIQAFRAPGMCWTPPLLEALNSLGIKYDFSSNLSLSEPVSYKRTTFYPFTATQRWNGTLYDYTCLLNSIRRHTITVFDLHPTLLVNQIEWDSIYYRGNPKMLRTVPQRPAKEIARILQKLEVLMKQIKALERAKIIDTRINLNASDKKTTITKEKIDNCYQTSMRWAINRFNYYPKFIKDHFHEFFCETYL